MRPLWLVWMAGPLLAAARLPTTPSISVVAHILDNEYGMKHCPEAKKALVALMNQNPACEAPLRSAPPAAALCYALYDATVTRCLRGERTVEPWSPDDAPCPLALPGRFNLSELMSEHESVLRTSDCEELCAKEARTLCQAVNAGYRSLLSLGKKSNSENATASPNNHSDSASKISPSPATNQLDAKNIKSPEIKQPPNAEQPAKLETPANPKPPAKHEAPANPEPPTNPEPPVKHGAPANPENPSKPDLSAKPAPPKPESPSNPVVPAKTEPPVKQISLPPKAIQPLPEKKDPENDFNDGDETNDYRQDDEDERSNINEAPPKAQEKLPESIPDEPVIPKESSIADPNKMSMPFEEAQDSYFLYYFLAFFGALILFYVLFHNKNKVISFLMGLLVEGRRGKTTRRRSGRVAYRKLDSTLEEAVSSTPPLHGPHNNIVY